MKKILLGILVFFLYIGQSYALTYSGSTTRSYTNITSDWTFNEWFYNSVNSWTWTCWTPPIWPYNFGFPVACNPDTPDTWDRQFYHNYYIEFDTLVSTGGVLYQATNLSSTWWEVMDIFTVNYSTGSCFNKFDISIKSVTWAELVNTGTFFSFPYSDRSGSWNSTRYLLSVFFSYWYDINTTSWFIEETTLVFYWLNNSNDVVKVQKVYTWGLYIWELETTSLRNSSDVGIYNFEFMVYPPEVYQIQILRDYLFWTGVISLPTLFGASDIYSSWAQNWSDAPGSSSGVTEGWFDDCENWYSFVIVYTLYKLIVH